MSTTSRLAGLVLLLVVSGLTISAGAPEPPTAEPPRSPLSPQDALKTIQVPPGFRVELFAAEPELLSPVAMAFDENGRVYVVEMGDYPLGKKMGRIKLLEDSDGDGKIDRSSVFADGLSFPNGVMPWQGGVLVTAAPDILFLKDTDGDGKADERRVIFTGFAESNPQHRFNTLTYGLDNWIYGADGDSSAGIRPGGQSDARAIPLRGSDFRFRPDYSGFETVSGRSQFAMTFDDWGNRFINHNSIHIRHPVPPQHYLKRNSNLAVSEVIDEIAGAGLVRVYPTSKLEPRFNDLYAAGHFTSACAVTIYRADGLGQEYRGNAFTCEPVHNLVHRDILTPRGASFTARSAYERQEFLTSTDNWFRPVNLYVGPDGALYVVDMYRAVIEHPQWIPLDVQKKINLRAGEDRGRIYRVVPEAGIKLVRPRLGEARTPELVGHLESDNAWYRTTAQRLLIERRDKTAVEPLRTLARDGKTPLGRLHALWTLEGLGALDEDLVRRALGDSEPGLREHGLRFAESRLSKSAGLQEAVLHRAADENPRVRFQAAYTLGALRDDRVVPALARIAVRDASDRWVRLAVLSSVAETAVPLLAEVRGSHRKFLDSPEAADLVRQIAGLIGARKDAKEVAELLRLVTMDAGAAPSRWQLAALSGLGENLRRSGTQLEKHLGSSDSGKVLAGWTAQALTTATAAKREVSERVDALVLLTQLPAEGATPRLKDLLRPQEPQQVQTAAVRALAVLPGEASAAALLADWNTRTAPVRREILGVLLGRADRTKLLLAALEKGDVRISDLDPPRRDQLLRYPDEGIRQRAKKLLASEKPSNRQKLIEEWSAKVLPLSGDAVRGQKVFAAHCATCHRLHGQGFAVGQNLAAVNGRSKEALLVDLLDPNRAVEPAFLDYQLVTTNDLVITGVIGAETANSVTLRRAEGQETTVLRRDIAEMRSTGVSLMPEGMEKLLSPQDLADLLELLRRGPVK